MLTELTVEIELLIDSPSTDQPQESVSVDSNLPPEYSYELLSLGFLTHRSYYVWLELRKERLTPPVPTGKILEPIDQPCQEE